ncbi:nucleolar protein of 40 kDa isoform X2 [Passer montanus]|uniref:nucleolar protein of 40 kDa isoform X2 n=1 Tax=Passer montanus TaxID=9160 RepID=UPI00196147A6|nr:nucleolar protein of 40 kDa isoform X2 [Passer montanus]
MEPLPELYSIFQGEVAAVTDYGAFIKIPGCRKQGLVHRTHMSSCPVDKPAEMLDVGDKVWVKLIGREMKDDKLKLSLSMKVVHQGTGKDLDPNNVSLDQDERKKRSFRDYTSQKITLEAVLNTVCKKCGCKGDPTVNNHQWKLQLSWWDNGTLELSLGAKTKFVPAVMMSCLVQQYEDNFVVNFSRFIQVAEVTLPRSVSCSLEEPNTASFQRRRKRRGQQQDMKGTKRSASLRSLQKRGRRRRRRRRSTRPGSPRSRTRPARPRTATELSPAARGPSTPGNPARLPRRRRRSTRSSPGASRAGWAAATAFPGAASRDQQLLLQGQGVYFKVTCAVTGVDLAASCPLSPWAQAAPLSHSCCQHGLMTPCRAPLLCHSLGTARSQLL